MGLDMYLYGCIKTSDPDDYDNCYGIWEEIAYWRKANQIHKWFKNKVIKDQNPWGLYDIEERDLQGLLILCKTLKMLKDNQLDVIDTDSLQTYKDLGQEFELENCDNADYVAYSLLPPDNLGCFFGSGLVDEDYWEDINYTINVLTDILKVEYDSYYYRASW